MYVCVCVDAWMDEYMYECTYVYMYVYVYVCVYVNSFRVRIVNPRIILFWTERKTKDKAVSWHYIF